MKPLKLFAVTTLSICSSSAISSPIPGVDITPSEFTMLSVLNNSEGPVNLTVYSKPIAVNSGKGRLVNCEGYTELEIFIGNNKYEFFKIPCNSQIVFNDTYDKGNVK